MKKLILVGLVLLLAVCLLGCGATEKEPVPESNQETGESDANELQQTISETKGNILNKVIDHLKSQGLEATDVHEKNAELIGAVAGLGFDIAGGPAEIYLFDPETGDADLLNKLENARTTEKYLLGTREVSSIMNGNIMLTAYEIGMVVHPEKDKLIEAFKSFSE
ncbi:MAG: hypothetical protein NUK65_09305 [Firmicutes bacterium]|nr:hypothetical protein [Bacillota bacterium]